MECLRQHRSRKVKAHMRACMLNYFCCVRLCVTLQTLACQAPLSMGFSRQEYWSELPCPPPGDFPDSGIEPVSLTSPALAGGFFTTEPLGKPSTTLAFHIPCLSSGMLRGHGSVLEQRCWDKEMLRADHGSSTNLQRRENRTLFCVLLVLSTKLLCPCENKFCLPQRLHNSLMVN